MEEIQVVKGRYTKTGIHTPPPLIRDKELADDAEGKGEILMDTFFPPPVQTDLDDIQMARYPTAHQRNNEGNQTSPFFQSPRI